MIAEVVMLAGAVLILLAAVGVIRFTDVLARMHSLTKASTLGLVLLLIGGAIGLDSANDVTFVVLAGLLQVLTSPVGANLLARSTYRARGIPHSLDAPDELADGPRRPARPAPVVDTDPTNG